jgi:hypothetical protein
MIVLEITDWEIHAIWDDVESKHPWGPMTLGSGEPSKYLLRAYEAGLISWDNALMLCMAATGVGEAHPECIECSRAHDIADCPMMQ